MELDYDSAMKLYVDCRNSIARLEAEHKERLAPIKAKMDTLIRWIEAKATEEGLKNVPTQYGTGYWSMHTNCSVANQSEFFDFVREHEAWDLIEKRASKTAVTSYLDAHNELPPGINYGRVRVFNIRMMGEKE